jgi:hypothetical protein
VGLLIGATSSRAEEFDPFADPFAPFAPVVVNVAKEGILTGNIGEARWPVEFLPQISNFEIVGHNLVPNPGDRIARGRNGFVAIAESGKNEGGGLIADGTTCAYIGSRIGTRTGTGDSLVEFGPGDFRPSGRPALPPEVAIVDITDPRSPKWVGAIPMVLGAQPREGRTIPDRNTLIVQNYATGTTNVPGPTDDAHNNLQVFDISDCINPKFVQQTGYGTQVPHEFFVWKDPNQPTRFLLYQSFSGSEPSLRVSEFMNPPTGSITRVASWTLTPAFPLSQPVDPATWADEQFPYTTKGTSISPGLHTMTVSEDGTRVYVSLSNYGFVVLDSSNLANRVPCTADLRTLDNTTNADPTYCLRKINPNVDSRMTHQPPYPFSHHSFQKIPNRPYGITSGERNGTTTCPWTRGEIVDLRNEGYLVVVSTFMVPENLPENCFPGGPGDPRLQREFSHHQMLVFENLWFHSWYSSGLHAWSSENPAQPYQTGVFVPKPEERVVEKFRQSNDVWIWPHPVLYNGLIYINDESSGLWILKYTGEGAGEMPKRGNYSSNQNYPRQEPDRGGKRALIK